MLIFHFNSHSSGNHRVNIWLDCIFQSLTKTSRASNMYFLKFFCKQKGKAGKPLACQTMTNYFLQTVSDPAQIASPPRQSHESRGRHLGLGAAVWGCPVLCGCTLTVSVAVLSSSDHCMDKTERNTQFKCHWDSKGSTLSKNDAQETSFPEHSAGGGGSALAPQAWGPKF